MGGDMRDFCSVETHTGRPIMKKLYLADLPSTALFLDHFRAAMLLIQFSS